MKLARMCIVFALTVAAGYAVRAQQPNDQQQEHRRRDQLLAAVQEICPVSGNRLGAHGAPIKVTVGEAKEEVFLCCRGCLAKEINPKHWATIHANFAKAQRVCPVTNKELPKSPKWTIAEGHVIFVCCPPCAKKIAADSAGYLRKLDQLYTASLQARRAQRSAQRK